jgi:hypothetical protein
VSGLTTLVASIASCADFSRLMTNLPVTGNQNADDKKSWIAFTPLRER